MTASNPYEAFRFSEWWADLTPTFVSFYFIAFVFVFALLYYLCPKRVRWCVLLIGSVAFYLVDGLYPLATVIASAMVVYGAGVMLGATEKKEKRKRRFLLAAGVTVLLGMLAFVKCYSVFEWNFPYIIPLGISYYTFSAVGYLADVYWGKEAPERNFFKLALFLLFFPKILQGPIAKHKNLAPQLNEGHDFDYTQFCYGIQLAIWGYFKKLVVADRLSTVTTQIFGNYQQYGGAILFVGMLLSAMQLYCDFSGCMDMAGGVSQMFGIQLEQNFNHPFFARSGAEFWQRWHMSLSAWFKDYLFLPVSRSSWVKKISKAAGKRFGATARKNSMLLISSFFVWVATGVWHGTGLPYIAWGMYWYLIINSSLLLEGRYRKLEQKLHVNTEGFGWKVFQMLRTYLIFSFGRVITMPNDLSATANIAGRFFTDIRPWQLVDGTLYKLGLSDVEFTIALLAILTVMIVENFQLRFGIRETVSQWNMLARAVFYSASVLTVLVFGIYGLGYGNTTFVYMNF